MTPRVAILDYGCGNLASVANAVRKVGGEIEWMTPYRYPAFTHIIIPGQGSFQSVAAPFADALPMNLGAWKDRGVPILGICLGMQLMCEGSEEAPGVKGLGWIEATCRKLRSSRLPHIGWNDVVLPEPMNPQLEDAKDFYFCHSYAVMAADPILDNRGGWTGAFSTYDGQDFLSIISAANLWAVQFHPEKSGRAGLALLAEFLKL